LEIHVSQYPPGTSQWNPIAHKVFSPISINWRGKPLDSFHTVVQYIAHTTHATGLKIKAVLDEQKYDIGRKVSKAALAKVNIERNAFQGKWNYIIRPTPPGGGEHLAKPPSAARPSIARPSSLRICRGLAEGLLLSRSSAELFDARS